MNIFDVPDTTDPRILQKTLSESLLFPNLSQTDTVREQMACQQINQAVLPLKPQMPYIYTGYEKEVARYNDHVRKFKKDSVIIDRVWRNNMNSTYIYVDSDGVIGCMHIPSCIHTTEKYGYPMEEKLQFSANQQVPAGTVVAAPPAQDEFGNLTIGRNVNVIFLSYYGLSFQDAMVVSESLAKDFTTLEVRKFRIIVNQNDVPLNLFGDKKTYQALPNFGEVVKNRIVFGSRRLINDLILSNMTASSLRQISESDTVYYAGKNAYLTDIEIYANDSAILTTRPEMAQLKGFWVQAVEYYEKLNTIFESLEAQGYTLDLKSAYLARKAKVFSYGTKKWEYNGSVFNNIVLDLTFANENPGHEGRKYSGRYGNKGVVSAVLPDDQMPIDEHGTRADAIMYIHSVADRCIPSAVEESELNALNRELVRRMKKMETTQEKENLLVDFLTQIEPDANEAQLEGLASLSPEEKVEYFRSIEEDGMMYICMPPYNTFNIWKLYNLYARYNFVPPKVSAVDHKGVRRWINNQSLMIGSMWLMRLKHDPDTKFNARSTGQLNLYGLPSKSGFETKNGMAPHSSAGTRFGEMEIPLISSVTNPAELMKLHATNLLGRRQLIDKLSQGDLSDIKVDINALPEDQTIQVLRIYMRQLGSRLVFKEQDTGE